MPMDGKPRMTLSRADTKALQKMSQQRAVTRTPATHARRESCCFLKILLVLAFPRDCGRFELEGG